jgi:hypothetical protein
MGQAGEGEPAQQGHPPSPPYDPYPRRIAPMASIGARHLILSVAMQLPLNRTRSNVEQIFLYYPASQPKVSRSEIGQRMC